MLRLSQVRMQGFRSFQRVSTLALDASGLVYISGHNVLEPALGANGVGKSTLFEAICWVLFGKTSLGLRAGDVQRWEANSTVSVWLKFFVDDAPYEIRRTWNPVGLGIAEDHKEQGFVDTTQERVEELVGYTYETFLFAVYHAQFGEFFSDLTPSRQLEVYTQVLALDLWEQLSDAAAAEALDREKLAQRVEVTLATRRGRLSEKQRAMEALEEQECAWWRDTLRDARAAQTVMQQAKANLDACKVSEFRGKDLQDLELQRAEVAGTERLARADVTKFTDRLEQLEALRELPAQCPTCKQRVDRAFIADHIKREAKALRLDLDGAKMRLENASEAIISADAALAAAREKAAQRAAVGERARAYARELNTARQQLLAIVRKPCPFDTEAEQEGVAALQAEVNDGKEELATLRQLTTDYRFWVQGFREIRLALIKASLAQFEVSTNSALAALGLGEWSVEYGVESETKGGKLKRGFSLRVRSPQSGDAAVPFAAWSGGEGQRLRLAITMGLSDLIQDFAGSACSVEIFDEPTAHLSEDGIQDLLALLAERAAQRQSVVLLADHHALDYGEFARIVLVEKTEKGSGLQ